MKKNTFIQGTITAYIAILLTKILGAIYVIPFYKIIGENGGILYSYAYNVYALFLEISTSGVPTAVAIIIAEYNTLKMFNEREYTYKVANRAIAIISFITFLIMFIFAGSIGSFFIGNLKGGNDIESVALVIRVISFCLLIVPFLSTTRGYLQGNKYTAVSSFSQLIEQFTRIAIVLVGSYVAINILNLSVPVGVGFALSGTVLGALAAFLYLRYKIYKNKKLFQRGVTHYKESTVKQKEILKKIATCAIPVVIISITQNLYNTIDLKLILVGLNMIGYSADKVEFIASIIITWGSKICMIINALATGMCMSIIPFIVNSYVKKDNKELNRKINQAINTILYIAVPLTLFIIIYSRPVYYIFYGANTYGFNILRVLVFVNLFFTLSLVLSMSLQGMKKYKIVYLSTFTGLIINTLLDVPMILLLNKLNFYPYIGSMVATIIGQIVTILMVLLSLRKEFKFSYRPIFKTLSKMIVPLLIIGVPSLFIQGIFDLNNYVKTFILLAFVGIIYVGVYAALTFKNHLLTDVLGNRIIDKLLRKSN